VNFAFPIIFHFLYFLAIFVFSAFLIKWAFPVFVVVSAVLARALAFLLFLAFVSQTFCSISVVAFYFSPFAEGENFCVDLLGLHQYLHLWWVRGLAGLVHFHSRGESHRASMIETNLESTKSLVESKNCLSQYIIINFEVL